MFQVSLVDKKRVKIRDREKFGKKPLTIFTPTIKSDKYSDVLDDHTDYARIYNIDIDNKTLYYTIFYDVKKGVAIESNLIDEWISKYNYIIEDGEKIVLYKYIKYESIVNDQPKKSPIPLIDQSNLPSTLPVVQSKSSISLDIGQPRANQAPNSYFAGSNVFAGTDNSNRRLVVTVEEMEVKINDVRNMFIIHVKNLEETIKMLESRIEKLESR